MHACTHAYQHLYAYISAHACTVCALHTAQASDHVLSPALIFLIPVLINNNMISSTYFTSACPTCTPSLPHPLAGGQQLQNMPCPAHSAQQGAPVPPACLVPLSSTVPPIRTLKLLAPEAVMVSKLQRDSPTANSLGLDTRSANRPTGTKAKA